MRQEHGGLLLAIDTSTSVAVVALGDSDGRLLSEDRWTAGYRHGEELLSRIDRLLRGRGLRIHAATAIVVGTGPGAFTGLRVGLATAKGLALALGRPIVAVPSGTALLEAARESGVAGVGAMLLLPAGQSDRILVRGTSTAGAPDRAVRTARGPGEAPPAVRLAADSTLDIPPGATLVAVDLEGRAEDAAVARGRLAQAGLAIALLRLGAERLANHGPDDLATVVPEYVTLPRGVERETGEILVGRA
jgi:tRNA threonylcarbamoyl adenosine modification protein YeaZ